MSNQPSSRNYLQAEALDFRSPVAESVLKTFGGTANWLLDKDTTNDTVTFPGINSTISTLTGRVNNAISYSNSVKFTSGFPDAGGMNTPLFTNNAHQIRIFQAIGGTMIVGFATGVYLTDPNNAQVTFLFPGASIIFTTTGATSVDYVMITLNPV